MRHTTAFIILITLGGFPAAKVAALDSGSFATCEEARAAVAAAGPKGLRLDDRFDPIYADRSCDKTFMSDHYSVFPESIRFQGKYCEIGYVCVRTTGGGANR